MSVIYSRNIFWTKRIRYIERSSHWWSYYKLFKKL